MRTFIILALVVGACVAQRGRNDVEDGKGPCTRPTGLFRHEEYCDKYYDCYKNDYRVVDCPNGLAFVGRRRGLTQNCDYPHRVECGKRTKRNPPIGNKPCNYLYGIVEHETSCTKYHTCWNGTATQQTCHKGLLWNQDVFACDWPQNVEGCQTHPLCAEAYDLVTDYPGTERECFKFVQCIGGYPRVQKCSAGLAFSSESKSCRHYIEVPDCADYFTTTPAPESESGESRDQDLKPRNNRNRGNQQQNYAGPRRGQGRF